METEESGEETITKVVQVLTDTVRDGAVFGMRLVYLAGADSIRFPGYGGTGTLIDKRFTPYYIQYGEEQPYIKSGESAGK